MLTFEWAGQTITKPCILIGIDPQGKAQVGPLIDYLDSYHDHWENGKLVRQATLTLSDAPNWNLTPEDLAYRRQTMEREVWINRQLQEDGPNGNDGFNPLKGDSGSNRSTPPGRRRQTPNTRTGGAP